MVGRRVRRARLELGMKPRYLGELLGEYLGRPWSATSVANTESGRRDFTATELVALAVVLGRPVAWFFTPIRRGEDPRDLRHQTDEATATLLQRAAGGRQAAGVLMSLADMQRVGRRLEQTAQQLERALDVTERHLELALESEGGRLEELQDADRNEQGAGQPQALKALEIREVDEEGHEEAPAGVPGSEEER